MNDPETTATRWTVRGVAVCLVVAAVAPAAVWLAGRGIERLWLGAEDHRGTIAATRAQHRIDRAYQTLFTQLSSAADAAARQPDLLRTARNPSAAKALFSLAAAAVSALDSPSDGIALTIYDRNGEPVAWTGKPSDLPPSAEWTEGFALREEQTGVRLFRVLPIREGETRVGSVVVERELAPSQGIRSRFGRDVDFTVASAGLPVHVAYATRPSEPVPLQKPAVAATFLVRDPRGGSIAQVAVSGDAVDSSRQWLAGVTGALAVASSLIPLLALLAALVFRQRDPGWGRYVWIVGLVWIVRFIILETRFPLQVGPVASFDPRFYRASAGGDILGSPADFALTGCAILATVVIAMLAFARLRRDRRHDRVRVPSTRMGRMAYLGVQSMTAVVAVGIAREYDHFIGNTARQSAIDLLHFSLHPWSTPRIALQFGMIALHASAALLLVLVFQSGLFIVRRPATRSAFLPAQATPWVAAAIIALVVGRPGDHSPFYVGMYAVAAMTAYFADRLTVRLRRHSASSRLAAGFVVLAVPALMWYPSTAHHGARIKRERIESTLAPQVVRHREDQFAALQQALTQIDANTDLSTALGTAPSTELGDLAFRAWEQTELFAARLTSAVEIYDNRGAAVSRFALNLPSYKTRDSLRETSASWQIGEETAPMGSRRVRVTYATRAVYANQNRMGLIVVRVAHDYDTLPIVASQNPYEALFGTAAPETLEDTPTYDVDLAVYDASRALLYASSRPAWTLNDSVAEGMRREKQPFWDRLTRTSSPDDVYVFSDPEAFYVLGFPRKSAWVRATEISELIALVGSIYLIGVIVVGVYGVVASIRHLAPTQVSMEIATSFYRKLSLAFVGASVVPIVILSLAVRAEFAARARAHIEAEAQTIVAVAKRVVEDYEASGGAAGRLDDDDVMVWIRSAIGQDVTLFAGNRLLASSQRDLFASGLLPTRTPAPLYETVALDRAPQYVGDERIGDFSYLTAAAPLRFHGQDAILTVPLAARQRESGREMDALDRELILVTLVFVLTAAALGYWMAERIANPIGRLTRATRRVAEGDLDAQLTTTSKDEIQRLVTAFNRMAGDLKLQREQLKHASRVEASAEMARQVAHEIKNPLTPIQLSAEHLRRVHADGTTPAPGVVDRCVGTILQQVRLLRQIANEFSTFGTTPTPDIQPWPVEDVLDEVTSPYQEGFDGRIEIVAAPAAAPELPPVLADRVLLVRALTNLVENAIQAIPGRGQVRLQAAGTADHRLTLDVIDTGTGIDPQVLARIFEPYFSTRTGGTGLGMAIVKRNIEACGGTIEVSSEPGRGTRVHIVLRAADYEPAPRGAAVDATAK